MEKKSNIKKKKINYTPLIIIIGLGIFLFILKDISKHITINISRSLPRGVYRLYTPLKIDRGDIIVFPIPENVRETFEKRKYTSKFVTSIMKKAAAFENDNITIKKEVLYINNTAWGKIYKYDSKFRALPELSLEEIIPKKNEILPLSNVDHSFDGRYFGPIEEKKIIYKAELLFTF